MRKAKWLIGLLTILLLCTPAAVAQQLTWAAFEAPSVQNVTPQGWSAQDTGASVIAALLSDYEAATSQTPQTVYGASVVCYLYEGDCTALASVYASGGQIYMFMGNPPTERGAVHAMVAPFSVTGSVKLDDATFGLLHQQNVLNYQNTVEVVGEHYFTQNELAKAIGALKGETGIVGTWSAQLADAVVTLTINADGTAQLALPGQIYRCEWTQNGEKLYLDQNGSVIACTIGSDSITLNIGGTKLAMHR